MENAFEMHSKYCQLPGTFKGVFGDTSSFFKGLENILGLPNPNVSVAIALEHEGSADSFDEFTPNAAIGIAYKPSQEYEFVVNPNLVDIHIYPATEGLPGPAASGGGRRPSPLQSYLDDHISKNANLLDEEVIALRLYTGPMFYKYNAVLRGFPDSAVNGLKGNRYITTIHAIVSGIISAYGSSYRSEGILYYTHCLLTFMIS